MNREEFLQGIYKDKILDDMLLLLRQETLPLIMWGCGDVGDAVSEYLAMNNIQLSGIWVDNAQEGQEYHGIPVDNRDGIMNKFKSFNVILGHSCYDLGEHIKTEYPQINKVFYAFSIHYGQYDRVHYEDIAEQADRFVNMCNSVADDVSVNSLMAYLNTKMTGDVRYIFDAHKANMNFYANDIFHVGDNEVLIDIGAYNGDTIKLFLEETHGKYEKIIAFEPDSKSFLELNDYISMNRLHNVVTSKLGAWNTTADLHFRTGDEQISSVYEGDIEEKDNIITIYADRIDRIFDENATLIKINYYEGVLEAVQGCERIIRQCHPKLAIDVGFDIYNVLKLFEYLDALDEGYRFYLRFNRAMSSTFTLYALTD